MAQLSVTKFIERQNCGLCGRMTLAQANRIGEFTIQRCSSCGFWQTGQLLDASTMAAYYQNDYGGLRQRQGQEVNAHVNLLLMERAGALWKGGKILDVGCGYGFL